MKQQENGALDACHVKKQAHVLNKQNRPGADQLVQAQFENVGFFSKLPTLTYSPDKQTEL